MTAITNFKQPVNESNVWKTTQTLKPIMVAAKFNHIYIIEEHYRDLVETFYKGAARSFRMREYFLDKGKWSHVQMTVLEDKPNLEVHKLEFEANGFNVTERKMNTVEEIKSALAGKYTSVVVDEFYLSFEDECLEISCFCEGTILDTAYEFTIPEIELENILEDMGITQGYNSDQEIVIDMNKYESLYTAWETILFTDEDQQEIVRRYLSTQK